MHDLILFTKKKAKSIYIYKMNKFHMYHLIKINTNLDIKFKMFTSNVCFYIINFTSNISSSYSYTINFMSKKMKSDIQLLLLPLITNFI